MTDKEKNWFKTDGSTIACKEKNKVLNENYREIRSMLQDAIDDAVLMGCSEKTFKEAYLEMLNSLKSAYPEQKQDSKDKEND